MVTVLDPCNSGGSGGGMTPSQVQQLIDNSIAKYRINVLTLTEEERAWVLEHMDMCIFYYQNVDNTENKFENNEIKRRGHHIFFDFPARTDLTFIDDLTIDYDLETGEERKIWKPYRYNYNNIQRNVAWNRMRQRAVNMSADPNTENFTFVWHIFKTENGSDAYYEGGVEFRRYFHSTVYPYFSGTWMDVDYNDIHIYGIELHKEKDDVNEGIELLFDKTVKFATVDYVDGIEAELATI